MKRFLILSATLTLTTACTEEEAVSNLPTDNIVVVDRDNGSDSCQAGLASCEETPVDEVVDDTASFKHVLVSCGIASVGSTCSECRQGGTTECCKGADACTVCEQFACWRDPPIEAVCSNKPC